MENTRIKELEKEVLQLKRAVEFHRDFCSLYFSLYREAECYRRKLLQDNPNGVFTWPKGFKPKNNVLPDGMA